MLMARGELSFRIRPVSGSCAASKTHIGRLAFRMCFIIVSYKIVIGGK